ncbi:MAG: sigma-54-dependent Fis family transcriptional regulator [Candidatus Hydrogenedentes bacterium]|nr:sigma-54-dependent Fis family transcriptional regulator [Candidatus Hydrogenedentota bacterium]
MLFAPFDSDEGGRENDRTVLVVDTDPGVRWALERGLQKSGFDVTAVGSVADALATAADRNIACIVMELLPEAGLTQDVLTMLIESPSGPRVICVAVDSAPQLVIECMRRGAADFLPKPFSLSEIRAALSRALDTGPSIMARAAGTPAKRTNDPSLLIGISPAIQELRTIIKQVAQTDLNCLIRGESGTGKDMVAREIHRLSRRSDKPFVKVNCTALPEQLLESELFGYEKGAFTGAVSTKPGRFELANRGIIFLDEIGDMHPNLQAKLLQVIEHKEFTKLGGRRHIQVDVQIIAATNAELEEKTRDGSFRPDLYFRLNEVCIWVPSLSSRKEDVPLLVRHFLQKHGRFTGEGGFNISAEDLASLANHPWPGNVRELESTIKRWLALGKSALGDRPAPMRPKSERTTQGIYAPTPTPEPISEEDDCEQIRQALERHQWNRRRAADDLGISYQTLRRRIEQYGLDRR